MQKSTVNLGSFKITDKIEIGVKGGSGNRKAEQVGRICISIKPQYIIEEFTFYSKTIPTILIISWPEKRFYLLEAEALLYNT